MLIACCCFLGPPKWGDHKCCALNRTTSYEAPRTHSKRVLCSTTTCTAGIRRSQTMDSDYSCATRARNMQDHLCPGAHAQYGHATWCNRIQQLTKGHEAIGSVLCSTTAKAWGSDPRRQSGQSNPPSQSSYFVSRFGVVLVRALDRSRMAGVRRTLLRRRRWRLTPQRHLVTSGVCIRVPL